MALEQLGFGCEDGLCLAGNKAGVSIPLGADQSVDGIVAVTANTGKLYWTSYDVEGATGIQGQTGIQGLQGNTGLQGMSGSTGLRGTTGLQLSTSDPWTISASTGNITGWDTTGGVYIVVQGHTGVFPYYYKS